MFAVRVGGATEPIQVSANSRKLWRKMLLPCRNAASIFALILLVLDTHIHKHTHMYIYISRDIYTDMFLIVAFVLIFVQVFVIVCCCVLHDFWPRCGAF